MSLTEIIFWWYTNLPPISIQSWQDMQMQFTNHFARTEPGVTLSDLARIQQKLREFVEDYLSRFKMAKIGCHVSILEREFCKRFDGCIFGYFVELA